MWSFLQRLPWSMLYLSEGSSSRVSHPRRRDKRAAALDHDHGSIVSRRDYSAHRDWIRYQDRKVTKNASSLIRRRRRRRIGILLIWKNAIATYLYLETCPLPKKSSLAGERTALIKQLKEQYTRRELYGDTIRRVVAMLYDDRPPIGWYYVVYEIVASKARRRLGLNNENRFQLCTRKTYYVSKKEEEKKVKAALTKEAKRAAKSII
jgi:hypothetical protein